MIQIKKYANRRLYNMNSSAYITLAECADIIRSGEHIQVTDARTHQDLTAIVMIQIIMEYEQSSASMLPLDALRQIICAYDSPASHLLSRYLERTISSFARHHTQLDDALEASLDAVQSRAALNDDTNAIRTPEASIAKTSDDPKQNRHETLSELKTEIERLHDRLRALEQ